jgi:thiol-disulfide isomerase/thioredoxin
MLGGPQFDTEADGFLRPPRRDPDAGSAGPKQLALVILFVIGVCYAAGNMSGPGSASGGGGGAGAGYGGYGKPVLLMFTADWCVPCQNFKKNVLHHSVVSARIDRSVTFRTVDLTAWRGEPARTATSYSVRAVPTLVLVHPVTGDEIARYSGPHDPEWFLKWLDRYAR